MCWWTIAAPVSKQASASATISSSVTGTFGFTVFDVAPLMAASIITKSLIAAPALVVRPRSRCDSPALGHPRQLDPLPPVEQCCRVALQRSTGQFQAVEVSQQPADRGPHFLASQVRAQAEVNAVSECQVPAGGPGDQESVGV